ncbi:MAG: D-alanyl-D-alanine carboxypeptidase [Proteobacteria bacterium]|nr:D-alanyl-D-alanine carboxypeptidase [Pseudomonadota bacterium]
MKHIALVVLAAVLFTQTAWAARAKVTSIAKDPYVSALVIDADTGKVLFSDQPDAMVYPASVLKLMNLLVILKHIEQGKIKLTDMVQITKEAAKIGGSQVYLDPKEQFSVEDLIYALAVQSANDAAVALAGHIAGSKEGFIALMNKQAAELGMKATRFHSVHGLPPSEGQKPDETTAGDLAILCRELAKRPDALKYTGTKERSFRDNKFMMRNHNHLLGAVDGCDGFKTGYYEAAGFSIAATAKRGGVRIIAIVMGSKNRKVRDAKTSELLAKGFSLLPPKPGTQSAAETKPGVAPKKIDDAPPPDKAHPEQAQKEEPPVQKAASGWGMFIWGVGTGLILFAVLTFFLLKKRGRKR